MPPPPDQSFSELIASLQVATGEHLRPLDMCVLEDVVERGWMAWPPLSNPEHPLDLLFELGWRAWESLIDESLVGPKLAPPPDQEGPSRPSSQKIGV